MPFFILTCICWIFSRSCFSKSLLPISQMAPLLHHQRWKWFLWNHLKLIFQTIVWAKLSWEAILTWVSGWLLDTGMEKQHLNINVAQNLYFLLWALAQDWRSSSCDFISHGVWQKGELYQDQWSVLDQDLFCRSAQGRKGKVLSPLQYCMWIYWELSSKAERLNSVCLDTLKDCQKLQKYEHKLKVNETAIESISSKYN